MKIFTLFGRLCIFGEHEVCCFDQIEIPEGAVITDVELSFSTSDKAIKMFKPKMNVVYQEKDKCK